MPLSSREAGVGRSNLAPEVKPASHLIDLSTIDLSGGSADEDEIDVDVDVDDDDDTGYADTHVEYILVASFDIDRGPVMEHQYPGPISGDEHMLAELMLPDQAHLRSQDWTMFFLHKDTTAEEEARIKRRDKKMSRSRHRATLSNEFDEDEDEDESDDDFDSGSVGGQSDSLGEDEGLDGPPLIYVLNLVNTKQDNSLKRGAIVKAMAICTRHSFLHIYKPLLLLALEEYFRSPTIDTLAHLYTAVNSMDLSLMPAFSHLERQILQVSDFKDIYIEKFQGMIHNRRLQEARKGQSLLATQQSVAPRDTHEFESRVLYNGIPVPIKIPTAISPETVGDFSIIQLIQTFSLPHAQSPQPFELHSHLTTSGPFTHPVIVLMNALLTQKRIVFLGHNMPSGSVAEIVLAACALASGGILRGFTRHAFPYTDLTKIEDLLKVPGFIAGVNNPAFKFKPEWWDLLCDLSTGRMIISKYIEAPAPAEGVVYFQNIPNAVPVFTAHGHGKGDHHGGLGNSSGNNNARDLSMANDPTGDAAFIEALQNSIVQKQGEAAVRSKWRNYISRFTRIAAAFEECVYGASVLYIGGSETDGDRRGFGVSGHGICWPDEVTKVRELGANASRIEGWRFTRSYYSFVHDLAREWRRGISLRGIDLRYQCDRLRMLSLGYDHSAAIYKGIARAIETAGIEPTDPIPPYYRTLYRRRRRRRRLRMMERMNHPTDLTKDGAAGQEDSDDDDDDDYDGHHQIVELVPHLNSVDEDDNDNGVGSRRNSTRDDSDEPLSPTSKPTQSKRAKKTRSGIQSGSTAAIGLGPPLLGLDPIDEDGVDDDEAGIESDGFLEERRADARYDVINQLLLALPEHQGCLFYISLGLFHPYVDVRRSVVGLLERVADHPAGRHYWDHLDRFAKLAFFRVKRELENMPDTSNLLGTTHPPGTSSSNGRIASPDGTSVTAVSTR